MMKRLLLALPLAFALLQSVSAQETIHIDPEYTGTDSDGSLEHPYVNWTQMGTTDDVISTTDGNTYLQKRGTSCDITARISMAPNTTFGAYGEGERPVIIFTPSLPGNFGVFQAFNSDQGKIHRNVTVQDLVIKAHDVTSIIICEGFVGDILIDNCELQGGVWGVRLLLWDTEQRPAVVTNCEIHDTQDDGIFVYGAPNLEIGYCYIHHVNQKYHTGPQPPTQSTAPGDCIQISAGVWTAGKYWIHHNLLDKSSTDFKFALIVAPDSAHDEHETIIEYNRMLGPGIHTAATVYLNNNIHPTIRGNVMSSGSQGIYNTNYTDVLEAYDNVFYGVNFALSNTEGTGANFYNNTMLGCGGVVQSNFIKPLHLANNLLYTPEDIGSDFLVKYSTTSAPPSGFFSSDYNLFSSDHEKMVVFMLQGYDTLASWQTAGYGANSIVGDPLITDYANNNLILAANSPARNAGIPIAGVTEAGDDAPDIGAPIDYLATVGIGPQGSLPLLPPQAIVQPYYGFYPVIEERFVQTDEWMGWLDSIWTAPWLYSWSLHNWVYLPEDQVTDHGGWVYIP